LSSFEIKNKFADRFDDPEKNLEKLRNAYKVHTDLITSGKIWEDNGKTFFNSEKELAKWSVEPAQNPSSPGSTSQGVGTTAAMPSPLVAPSFLHGGYPAVILLSVSIFAVSFLAYRKIIPPNFTVMAIMLCITLFFLPTIIDRIGKILPIDRFAQKDRSIPDLFKQAHDIFANAIISIRNVGKYEDTGVLEKDPAEQRKLDTVSELLSLYGEIFHRSEREWYNRSLVKQEYATRMAGGGIGSASDVPG
jgi:hypothetical protein